VCVCVCVRARVCINYIISYRTLHTYMPHTSMPHTSIPHTSMPNTSIPHTSMLRDQSGRRYTPLQGLEFRV